MIPSLLVLAQTTSRVPILEYPDESEKNVALVALIRLSVLDGEQRYGAEVLARVAARRTYNYQLRETLQVTAEGDRPRCELMPGYLRFTIVVPKNELKLGLSMLEGLILRPALLVDEINSSEAQIAREYADRYPFPVWKNPLRKYLYRASDWQPYWASLIKESETTIAVAGNIAPGEGVAAWLTRPRTFAVNPGGPLRLYRNSAAILEPKRTIRVMRAESKVFSREQAPLAWLLATLLGSGKESQFFRVLREQLRLSYRQEAMLTLTPNGPIIVAAVYEDRSTDSRVALAVPALKAARLTQEDLTRALGVMQGQLAGTSPFHSVCWGDRYGWGTSLQDRTARRLTWEAMTGFIKTPEAALADARGLSLSTVQKELDSLLDGWKFVER